MAAVELARLGERLPKTILDRIKNYLLNARGMTAQVTTILYAISAMGEDGVGIYEAFNESQQFKNERRRGVAEINVTIQWMERSKFIFPAMNDKDKGVRDAVLNQLRGRVDTIGSRGDGSVSD